MRFKSPHSGLPTRSILCLETNKKSLSTKKPTCKACALFTCPQCSRGRASVEALCQEEKKHFGLQLRRFFQTRAQRWNISTVARTKHKFPARRNKKFCRFWEKFGQFSKKLCQNIILGSLYLK
jgi:hypothetical protein